MLENVDFVQGINHPWQMEISKGKKGIRRREQAEKSCLTAEWREVATSWDINLSRTRQELL